MKLIDEAKHWYKMFSVQANLLAGAVVGAYQMLPDDFKHTIPQQWMLGAAMALVALGTVGRFVDQGLSDKDKTDKE